MDKTLTSLLKLESEFESKLPPVDQWDPPLSGDLDMRIDREGRWFYQGGKIERFPLIKLFSSILKKEGDDYYLVTPVEKWRIEVDVAPLIVTSVTFCEGSISFTTSVDGEVVAGVDHPIFVLEDGQGNPLPMVKAHRGIDALISRPVFYELVEMAQSRSAVEVKGKELFVTSQGIDFVLGEI